MVLTSTYYAYPFQVTLTGPTVVSPGEKVKLNLMVNCLKKCMLTKLHLEFPEVLQTEANTIEIMQELSEGQSFEKEIVLYTRANAEGFGEIHYRLAYQEAEQTAEHLKFTSWISVFKRAHVAASGLSDPLRERLVSVVNARNRNGHIFLADFVSFINDFLNIEIPDRIATILAEEFAFPDEGLPVDREKYIAIIHGEFSFYGIDRLELINEEDCNESDDKFDMSEAAEVNNSPVN